jgi:hypothetical protein
MTFDLKHRLRRLVFRPDADALAQHREAWRVLTAEARKTQAALSIEIEDEGIEAVVRRIIDSGSPIEHIALLDGGLFGPAGDAYQITAEVIQDVDGDGTLITAWEQRAKTFLRAVLGEGETAGHVHCANGHAALP